MDGQLQPLHSEYADQWARLLAWVQGLAPAVQSARPSARDWSPLEVLHHCLITEGFSRIDSGLRTRSRSRHPLLPIVTWGMRQGRRMPAPSAVEPVNVPGLDAMLDQARERGQAVAAALEGVSPNEPIAQHPIFGALSARQYLRLYASHLEYHWLHRNPK